MSRLLAVLLANCLSGVALAQTAAPPSPDPIQQTISAIKGLIEQRPTDPSLYYFLASFQARAKERDNALGSLRKVIEIGDGFLPPADFGFENLKDDPEFQNVRAEMGKALPVVSGAPVAFRIPDRKFTPEGIAYDLHSNHFFVGSVAQNRIVKVSPTGRVSPFSRDTDGLRHILGIAVDAKRRSLYAVSTSALTQPEKPVNGVVRYDLKSGKRVGEYLIAGTQQLNDVAVAPNGDLYVSDSGTGAIWRIAANEGIGAQAQSFIGPGAIRGTNGIALSADGKMLFAAHSTGVVRIDTLTAKIERLVPPARQTIAAIDGLYVWNGDLIGIQNVTNPGRLIRIRMKGEGPEVDFLETLQSHHQPDFIQPTTGAIAGNAIYVLGTTQVGQFNAKGEFDQPDKLKEPAIVKVALAK